MIFLWVHGFRRMHCRATRASDAHALSPRLSENGLNTLLVDCFQCLRRHFQGDVSILLRNVESSFLKIKEKATLHLVVGVGNVVARPGSAPRYVIFTRHVSNVK